MKEDKGKSILEYILYILLIIMCLVFCIIISKFIIKDAIEVNIPSNISERQYEFLSAIDNNNTGQNISNIIGATTIFFTILVLVISIHQFIKIKEFDVLKKEFSEKSNELNKLYDDSVKKLNDVINKEITQVNKEKIKNKIYINLLRAEMEQKKKYKNNQFLIRIYEEVVELIERYGDDIVEEEEISRMYEKLGLAYACTNEAIKAEKFMLKSLEYLDYNDLGEVSKRINLAKLHMAKGNYSKTLDYLEISSNINYKITNDELMRIHLMESNIFEAIEDEERYINITK